VEDVLDRERDARECSGAGAACESPVEPPRLVERPILVEREKSRELGLEGPCAVEVRTSRTAVLRVIDARDTLMSAVLAARKKRIGERRATKRMSNA